MQLLAATLGALAAAASASALRVDSGDTSYVVQLHASREPAAAQGFAADARSQVMTLASGQRFECFVPLSAQALAARDVGAENEESDAPPPSQERSAEQESAAFLAFGRAAARKIRPKCVQFVDMADNWVYEVCPGVLVRRVSLRPEVSAATRRRRKSDRAAEGSDDGGELLQGDGEQQQEENEEKEMEAQDAAALHGTVDQRDAADDATRSHDVVELGQFVGDGRADALAYSDFVGADTQERVRRHQKPLFTQTYRLPDSDDESDSLQVQFICSAAAVDDTVAGVQWRKHEGKGSRAVSGFLVLSRVFCDPQHADESEFKLFTVPSLLQPLVDARTCVKRNEGWWTYEFCFGRSIRQYHRDSEGKVTAEFSLGQYDAAKNQELAASGGSLVVEHIDATHDVARPAFLELYDQGSHCKEFDHYTPRRAKVYYYCSQGGASHHILAVKETQTCAYAIKVSSPALCDHPHFLSEEQKSDAKAEVVHCIPLESTGEEEPKAVDTTSVPAAASANKDVGGNAPASDEL